MKISICMPAFGRARMVCQALHSILIQDHEDWEVVIRDDDPEHPLESSAEFQKLRPVFGQKLNYFIEDHLGSFSRVCNAVLRRATGQILYIMGSDDLLCPNALYQVNKVFEEDRFGGAFWLYGKTVSVDAQLRFEGVDGQQTTLEELGKKNCIGMPSTFWTREMMELAGNFDTRYKRACDYDLWLRFWRRRDPIFLNEHLGIYRHHNSNMSKTYREETEFEARKVSERHANWSKITDKAWNVYNEKHSFDGDYPTSHDG